MNERALLMELAQDAETVEPDWPDAVARAKIERSSRRRQPTRSRRLGVVFTLVAGAAVLGMSAFASQSVRLPYWTFGDSRDIVAPAYQRSTLSPWGQAPPRLPTFDSNGRKVDSIPTVDGETAGNTWTLQTFVERARRTDVPAQLCVAIGPRRPRPANEGDFASCSSPDWVDQAAAGHHVAWAVAIPGRAGSGPKFFYGSADPRVATVDLLADDDRVVSVQTFGGPAGLAPAARYWVAVLPLDRLVHEVVPRDGDGTPLEEWQLEVAQ